MALFHSRHFLAAMPLLASVLLGTAAVAPARADEPESIEQLTQAAAAVLEKHCARCHQEGKLIGRDKAEKGFGNVLHLDEILRNPALVKPGVPEGSKLYNMMVNSQMPYDVFQEFSDKYPEPSKDEVLAIRKWISAAKVTCAPEHVVSSGDILKYVADDLRSLPKSRIATTRYITLSHYANGCATEEQMEVYRQGVVKFLNSMSRVSDVVKLETADPGKTIVRFNLSDLGWAPEDWEMLAAVYPYRNYADDPLYKFTTDATYTAFPYMRGDWLIFNAAQPPFYEKILRLPTSYAELQKKLAVDVDANIANYRVARAGFQESGVSQHNRLIERHTIATGYFWTSYDFGGDSDEQSFFEHPTGPHGHDGFRYDGGETIFSLPNGFQAYGLYTSKGSALTKGPTNIVRDPKRRDQAVANGISCMGCHDQGIKLATDQVRDHVLGAKSSFPKPIRDAVKELYPEKAAMDQLMAQDAKRFHDAQIRAGLNPALELNGDEPVNAVSRKYELPVDLTQAAAELGISLADMERDLTGTDAAVVRRLKLGSLPREQFETAYAGLVKVLTEDVFLGAAKQVAHDVPKPADMPKPGADPAGQFSIEADKAVYQQNDYIVLNVSTTQSCFLTLVDVDGSGKGTVIFPNKFQPDNSIPAGKVFRFGDTGSPFRLRLADRGTETIIAECSTKPNANPDVAADYKAGGLTDIGDYVQKTIGSFGSRAIKVEAAKGQGGGTPSQIKQEVSNLGSTARTAIKVEVR
jgi:hypothetical protein